MKEFPFFTSKKFAIPVSGEKVILKNISTEKESGEPDEFHDSQKYLRETSSKKFSKKIFSWIFYVFQI